MYVGFENSSTAINGSVLTEDGAVADTFSIDRPTFVDEDRTILGVLGDHVDLDAVEMVSYCFAWGDGQDAITDIEATTNKGNRGTPGFTPKQVDADIFDQLVASELPVVTLPGVNDRLECLHPYFRHYAQLSGPDKVADARNAQRLVRAAGGEGDRFVVANASSSSRSIVVADGRVRGAFHWAGLVHGMPDGDIYDALMSGEVNPQQVVERAGFLYKPGKGRAEWEIPAEYAEFDDARHRMTLDHLEAAAENEELLELVFWAALHSVYSLVPFAVHEGRGPLEHVVVSGRLARVESPVDVRGRLQSALSALGPTTITEPFGTARGAALIAKDVAEGAPSVLGIPVESPPAQ